MGKAGPKAFWARTDALLGLPECSASRKTLFPFSHTRVCTQPEKRFRRRSANGCATTVNWLVAASPMHQR
eukprot:5035475-Pyramimonas_sp.AAC.1